MKDYLRSLIQAKPLNEQETSAIFDLLMGEGEVSASESQIGAYLFATAGREPDAVELVGAAKALRRRMVRVNLQERLPGIESLDTCGTGGSRLNTFNASTAAALLCAAAGQYVAKHGNRAATSASGSVDVLEALGVNCELTPQQIAECCAETRFCFLFAPKHHPATARVARIRRELGFRTIFNYLGPLVNPAGAQCQVLGVSSRTMLGRMAEALRALGSSRVLVANGDDGLDEISLCANTLVNEVREGKIKEYIIDPTEFGFPLAPLEDIQAQTPQESARIIRDVFSGHPGSCRNMVLLNAGAGLYISGKSSSIQEGLNLAAQVLDSGKAAETLEAVKRFTMRFKT